MNTKLHEEEEIVESFPADILYKGTPSAGASREGTIFLTNLRFIYEPSKRKQTDPFDFLVQYKVCSQRLL